MLPPGKKIYFLSDFHLGAPNREASLTREKKIVEFLNEIRTDAAVVFIVGDMFDFWYEYRLVVPKGYVRLLGTLASMTDEGIRIHFFVGNHDMWMKDYFEKELNISTYFHPANFSFNNQSFHIAHGDGLGPGDQGYKMLKKVFRNRFCTWLFGIFPPYLGMGLANYFSRKSRAATGKSEEEFLGRENEWLISYSQDILKKSHFDYLIFGHRHLPIDLRINENSRYINLGDWINYYTYAEFDGQHLRLRSRYPEYENKIVRE
jgi:UDP-2,3-diacylglucosamine hydrolase